MFRHSKNRLNFGKFLLWRKSRTRRYKAKAKIKQQLAHVPERKEDMSSYSEGQTHQLMDVFEAEQFSATEITKLRQNRNLFAGIKAVLNGTAKIKPVSEDATRWITLNETTIAVYLGATPNLPFDGSEVEQHVGEGWVIVEKRADGLYVNGRKVNLHLPKRQKGGKLLKGFELREELTGKPVLNANILDALYENTHLIPEDWKKDEDGNILFIFFWGTIYRGSLGRLCVRFLWFGSGAWVRPCYWLDGVWGGSGPAVLLAQPAL